MPTVTLIDESAAPPEARAVFHDIKSSRNTDWINNFWKALASHPPTLRRTWESLKEVHGAGNARSADQGADLSRGQRQQRLPVLHRLARGGGQAARNDAGNVRRAACRR